MSDPRRNSRGSHGESFYSDRPGRSGNQRPRHSQLPGDGNVPRDIPRTMYNNPHTQQPIHLHEGSSPPHYTTQPTSLLTRPGEYSPAAGYQSIPAQLQHTGFNPPAPSLQQPLSSYPSSLNVPGNPPNPPLGYPASATQDSGDLDPRYLVQHGSYFKVGKVFSILWHENHGPTPSTGTHKSAGPQFEGRFGEKIYSTIRRMVIIKESNNCCWCFAISTYGGRGVAKPGVDPSKHAIVYMKNGWAMRGPNEPRMTKEPLEVTPERYSERLDGMSRLNFGKIYTVEHNVKILPIGAVTASSIPRFLNYARTELSV